MNIPELALEIVNSIGKMSKQPNELGKFLTDFTNATIKWIRPLFLIDEKEDNDFTDYKNNPDNSDSKDIVIAKIKKALNNNIEMQEEFKKIINSIAEEKSHNTFASKIVGDKNIVIQGATGNTITITNS